MRKIYNYYKYLFDRKISNSTWVLIIISVLIIFAWVYIPKNELYLKTNVLENKKIINNNLDWKIIIIDWVKYKLVLQN